MTFEVMTQPNEILKAAKALKNGKSAAGDLISNEMIKYGFPVLIEPILKLFNLIFEKGDFPKLWNESYITLLHKKGGKSDPANYSGISLTSNLGKLFNKVLYARILKFLNLNKIIHENQIGFKEDSRTTDHIFTLKSIIENYKSQKKKIFAPFIDLRKTFDTVWHKGLFYVLLKHNFPHKIFKMIHSMYQDTHCKIKFKTGISRDFVSTCGVKQGDVLSPILFNLYINSIVDDLQKAKTDHCQL